MKRFSKTIISLASLGMLFSIASCGSSETPMSEFERKTRDIYESGLREGSIKDQTYEEWLESIRGEDGKDGNNGQDGHTPVIVIGTNGNWYIDNVDTGISAQGPQGEQGPQGNPGQNGKDGQTPYIGDNGHWWIGTTDTGYPAVGQDGTPGENGKDGVSISSIEKTSSSGNVDTYTITFSNNTTFEYTVTNGVDGSQGQQGQAGQNGYTPYIGSNGHWWINDEDTGVSAQGVDAYSPFIGENGNWWVVAWDGQHYIASDTFVSAQGPQGEQGKDGSSVLTGNGVPNSILGNDNDSYINLDNWDYYVKENGVWILKGNIKGSEGQQGPQGEQGIQGEAGKDGRSVVSIVLTSSSENIDTYTITYSDNTTSTFTVTNGTNGQDGAQGIQGIQGEPGADGHTPEITIGSNGNWFVDGSDTGVKAQGPQGPIGPQGEQGPQGEKGDQGETGVSIINTFIDDNGDLIIEYSNGTSQNAGHMKDTDVYTVTFHVDDEIVATRNVIKGDKVSRPTLEETAGYTISDWYFLDGSVHESWKFFGYVVTEDIDLYAEFTYNEYTISFIDEIYHHEVDNLAVIYDHEFELPSILQTGYSVRWKDGEENVFLSGKYRVARDITLYAVWDANTYTVTLNPNGGSLASTTVQVVYEAQYTLPIPTRLNYIFLGWFDGDTKISNNATWKYAEDKLFAAKWTNVTNTYVFDAGDGMCDINSMVIGWEDEYTLPTPTLSGYTFVSWFLEDQAIPQNGIWTYSNSGGTLTAVYRDERLLFVKNLSDSYEVKASSENISGDIVIPYTFCGLPVVSIGNSAFADCTSLTSITIPNSVTYIGQSAFLGCSALNSINIPDSVTYIDSFVFRSCTSLTSITIPNSVTRIWYYAFDNCKSLKTIIIPDSVIQIAENAFIGCYCTIYCRAKYKPSSWNSKWYGGDDFHGTIVWGYEGE